jgi:putative FmdB family regulatory protein
MPTYEFRCPLGHEFEKFYRSISRAEAQVACPECGQIAERMMSAGAGLVFKGSGFYLTDYGKNAHRGTESGKAEGGKSEGATGDGAKSDGAKASADGGSSSGSGDSAKSEPKPEPKAAESKPAPPSKPSSGE